MGPTAFPSVELEQGTGHVPARCHSRIVSACEMMIAGMVEGVEPGGRLVLFAHASVARVSDWLVFFRLEPMPCPCMCQDQESVHASLLFWGGGTGVCSDSHLSTRMARVSAELSRSGRAHMHCQRPLGTMEDAGVAGSMVAAWPARVRAHAQLLLRRRERPSRPRLRAATSPSRATPLTSGARPNTEQATAHILFLLSALGEDSHTHRQQGPPSLACPLQLLPRCLLLLLGAGPPTSVGSHQGSSLLGAAQAKRSGGGHPLAAAAGQ